MKALSKTVFPDSVLPSSSPDWDEEITSGLLSQDIDPTDTDVFSLEDLEWVNNVSE